MARAATRDDWGEPQTVERNGSELHYWLEGPEDAPLVVFTHGASMDHRMFDPQRDALRTAGYRLLVWDMRGHGESKPMGDEFSVSTVAADLKAILDTLDASELILAGHSFGGYVSQEFLYQYPDRVTALVIIGSSDLTASGPRREELLLSASPYMFKAMPDSMRRRLVSQSTGLRSDVKKYAYEATSQLTKEEFYRVWHAVADHPRPDPDYRISCPFLLTHGDRDIVGTIAKHAPEWASREPNCTYHVIPDAGHNSNQDNPNMFNKIVLEFLEETVPVN